MLSRLIWSAFFMGKGETASHCIPFFNPKYVLLRNSVVSYRLTQAINDKSYQSYKRLHLLQPAVFKSGTRHLPLCGGTPPRFFLMKTSCFFSPDKKCSIIENVEIGNGKKGFHDDELQFSLLFHLLTIIATAL